MQIAEKSTNEERILSCIWKEMSEMQINESFCYNKCQHKNIQLIEYNHEDNDCEEYYIQ